MLSLLLFFLLIISPLSLSSSPIGINYGQVANNLPTPSAVLPLLLSLNASRVKLYDSNPQILKSFSDSHIEFIVGIPDASVPSITDPKTALSWLSTNIKPFFPKTKVVAITVGNEILSGDNSLLLQSLVPAMYSLQSALTSLGYDKSISITTAHSLNVLSSSFPPSSGAFRKDLLIYVKPLLAFLKKYNSPFLINAYPFFAYKGDPKKIDLDYVLFETKKPITDSGSGLKYYNMLHAQVDAVRYAIAAAGGDEGIEVRVSETGWPSSGDEDEIGATAENARKYNGNLMKLMESGKGTPMSPDVALEVYVFALFNENLKPGPGSERHYGLFNPDGSPAYDIGVKGLNSNSTGNGSGGGSGFAADSPVESMGNGSAGNYYDISSANQEHWLRVAMVVIVLAVSGSLFLYSLI